MTCFGLFIQAAAYHHSQDNDAFNIDGQIDYPNDPDIRQINSMFILSTFPIHSAHNVPFRFSTTQI
jgi:hypothetical protein